MTMRAGIVSMMRNPGKVLETFVRYHRKLGFSDFIILFDDPNDWDIPLAKQLPGVIAVPVDGNVRRAWKDQRHYAQCKDHVDQTVGARQLLNIEYGFNIALEEGIDWLLHVDIDELFFLKDNDLEGHLKLLADTGKEAAVYYNYEAVPSAFEIEDYFKQVRDFKKPIKLLQHQNISRRGVWPKGRRYFNFYVNGKSMTRVLPGVYPLGAHRWAHAEHTLNKVVCFNPCVLHFAVCGYRYFEQKYRHRGNFSDIRIDKDLRKSGADLDLDARDAFMSGDLDKAKGIYRDRVMMDKNAIASLTRQGILKKFDLGPLFLTEATAADS